MCFIGKLQSAGKTAGKQKNKTAQIHCLSGFIWCERWDLNPHVKDTRTSNVPVCLFQHSRIFLTCLISQLLYYSTDFVVCKALFRFFCFLMQNVKSTLKRKVAARKIPRSNPIAKKKKHSKHSIKHAEPHEMPGSHTQE